MNLRIGHVELQNRRQMSKESTFRVWTLVLLMRNGNFSVERLMDLLIALMPSNPKAPWYFEIDHENMILSPKLPEVPPR